MQRNKDRVLHSSHLLRNGEYITVSNEYHCKCIPDKHNCIAQRLSCLVLAIKGSRILSSINGRYRELTRLIRPYGHGASSLKALFEPVNQHSYIAYTLPAMERFSAMITIEHYSKEYPPMVSWSIREAIVGETRDDMGLYWSGIAEPNYPMPATLNLPTSLIAWLWVHVKRTKRNNKKLMQWYLALCFDKRGHYIG